MITDREIILAIVDNDCLAHSDAAILLEGDGFFRFQKAVDLYKKGTVDRMDRLPGGPVRIVDYKTGAVSEEDTGISDANAGDVLKNLFGKGSQDRPTIALQMYFYDMLVRENDGIPLAGLSNSVYALSRLFVGDVADEPVSEAFLEGVRKGLSALLAEIADLSVPFERKGNVRTDCKYCDFKKLCKR